MICKDLSKEEKKSKNFRNSLPKMHFLSLYICNGKREVFLEKKFLECEVFYEKFKVITELGRTDICEQLPVL